jgi:two-component system, OmpR family, copper resistance phosphate regulon response regulator CusR
VISRVLLVEDEDRIASFITKGLASRGFEVDRVANGRDVDGALDGVDVIVLDLGLPGEDGLDVLTRLRASGRTTPVVILTARSDVEDRVAGLELGADDYVPKPFAIDELAARLRARVRQRAADATTMRAGEIELDLVARTVAVDGNGVELTPREFTLLETLMREPGRAFSREELLERVWGLTFDPRSNLVDVYVRYLRKKLGSGTVRTVRGVGYAVATGAERRRRRRTSQPD